MIGALILIGIVAIVAFALRAMGGRRDATIAPADAEARRPVGAFASDDDDEDDDDEDDEYVVGGHDEDDDDDEDELAEAAAVTSDGWSFVPRGSGLELVPPGEDDDLLRDQAQRHGSEALRQAMSGSPVNPQTGRRMVFWKMGDPLSVGDMIAARVVRGAPDVDPWRLEALGRDYDYRSFAFETEEAARTALDLVLTRVVRPPVDEHGESIPVGAEDFVVARRTFEETEQALAMDQDDEEKP